MFGNKICKRCNEPVSKDNKIVLRDGIYCKNCGLMVIASYAKKVSNPKKATTKINKSSVTGWNELISPKTFDDYVGQEVIKKELRTMLDATKIHGIPIQHVLFSGNFGLGKTTIARIFANYVGDNDIVTAVNIKEPNEFPKNSVVVVDEIHTIRDEEWLLGIMDRGNQTILGATTTAGSLSGPLRSRFVSLVLQPYNEQELERMILGAARNLKYDCPDYVAREVAKRGKTVARIALFLFKRIYDRIILNGNTINQEILKVWFKEMSIDVDGLDNADRAYINCLSDKPIGLQNLSAITGFDRITIEETIEPYLLTKGFVKRTPRGRVVGDRKVLGIWE